MKKIILLASLVLSTSVFAATSTVQSERTFTTDSYASKEQAYQAGFGLVEEFKQMSQNELENKLVTGPNDAIYQSIIVNDMNVAVKEFGTIDGKIEYKAVVDIDYQYKHRESNHS
ncbi:DUF3316 domain-containing protein [Vibrio sinaloensis]|uniref:DUF3316 domain-containing protein n=1 Tax=Photobacterium sp. (strain ATCC 43367) TaxID=379097 RepID=UPI00057DDA25|nr:DUF3316 domain-containing protein [Vibrio sinaloensis]KHT51580.1 acyl-CoA synthetase [Vibrio sinaloensis]